MESTKYKIEAIKLKNFRAFKDIEIKNLPSFCVFVGANGTGKTTIFKVFTFLQDAINQDIDYALNQLGGNKGFKEVCTRGETSNIEISIKFRAPQNTRLITYYLSIGEKENNEAYIAKEVLSYRRGNRGKPWNYLDFSDGIGQAVTNETDLANITDEKQLTRDEQKLTSSNLLAITGLTHYEKFPSVVALGNLIKKWQIYNFHIEAARKVQIKNKFSIELTANGDNLSSVLDYLHKRDKEIFDKILEKLSKRIPGVHKIDVTTTEDNRILLKFNDSAFKEPFLSEYVSDGTLRMLSYLTLIYSPIPFPLLGIEEPENQLHHSLLERLAEEFRVYTDKGSQVFISTHSPDFLNNLHPEEVFCLIKSKGYTKITRASDDEKIINNIKQGATMGELWSEGWLK